MTYRRGRASSNHDDFNRARPRATRTLLDAKGRLQNGDGVLEFRAPRSLRGRRSSRPFMDRGGAESRWTFEAWAAPRTASPPDLEQPLRREALAL